MTSAAPRPTLLGEVLHGDPALDVHGRSRSRRGRRRRLGLGLGLRRRLRGGLELRPSVRVRPARPSGRCGLGPRPSGVPPFRRLRGRRGSAFGAGLAAARSLAGRAELRDDRLRRRSRSAVFTSTPAAFSCLDELLAGDAELLGRFVNPHLCPSSNSSHQSLELSGCSTAASAGAAEAPLPDGLLRHPTFEHTYAPRPGARPPGSSATTRPPSRTIRTSSVFGARRRQPMQVRTGSRLRRRRSSAAASAGASARASAAAAPHGSARLQRALRLRCLCSAGRAARSSCGRASPARSARSAGDGVCGLAGRCAGSRS